MHRLFRRKGKRSTAQAMVEFGLALPILLIVMYGLIESGRLLFLYASVVSAARQAVRYGSVTGDSGSGVPYYNDCAGIRDAAKHLGFIQPFSDSDIQISYDNGPGATVPWSKSTCPITGITHPINGDRITVRVSTDYAPIVPLVPFGHFTIASSGSRTLLVNISVAVSNPGVALPPGSGNVALTKDASPSSYDTLGQAITYTYTINNLGSDPVTNLAVNDDLATVSCLGATDPLPSGTTTCHGTYYVTQADIDRGHITNIATFQGLSLGVPVSASASKTINFVPRPKLTLLKEGDVADIVGTGYPVNYTFTLTNSGNIALTGPYTINDPNLDSWTCASATSPLAPGASTTCTGTHIITNNDMNRTYVDNTATATATYNSFVVTSNSASIRVLVPALLLQMSASPTSVSALGTTITYTYTLTNRSPSGMTFIYVTDTRNGFFLCLSSLAQGATASCTKTYTTYTQTDMNAGYIIAQASAKPYRRPSSNTASVTVTVTQTPALTLTKTASPTTPPAAGVGTVITYSYSFKNTGNVTLNVPYTVSDNKLPGINCTGATGTLAPGASKSCANKTYTVVQADVDAGSIVNQATVSGMFGTTTVTSPATSAVVVTFAGARLGLVKTATPLYFSSAGQTIQYNFKLVNKGGVALGPPYSVLDPNVPVVSCPTDPLPIGGSITCTGNYTVTSADMANLSITNNATASATNGAIPVLSPPATLKINEFMCDNVHLKATPTPIASGTDVFWTIINNTGLPVHIGSATVSWYSGNPLPYLTQVLLGGSTIFTGTNGSYSGFVLPGTGWTIPTGNTPMELKFSTAASGIHVILTFTDTGCSLTTVDSNVNYGG